MSKVNLLGYQISNCGLKADISSAWQLIKSNTRMNYMVSANPHSLVVASKDNLFQCALKEADILIPDGTGIVLAAKLMHFPLTRKVAGFDFFIELSAIAQKNGGLKYFFLGSSNKVLELIISRLSCEFPFIKVCGTYSPPFKNEFSDKENAEMIDAVNLSRPDVLWVGMTAPKQEKWIYLNRHNLEVSFVGAVGAVFDFYAGTKKRSGLFWQQMGLEWLPRFLREPNRLWKRDLHSTPIFLSWVIRDILVKL